MKSLEQYKEEVRAKIKPLFIITKHGIFYEVLQRDCDDNTYETIDKFEIETKANEHCEALNEQYKDSLESEICTKAKNRYRYDKAIEEANCINDLCNLCWRKDNTVFCPNGVNKRIKKIQGLRCNNFIYNGNNF